MALLAVAAHAAALTAGATAAPIAPPVSPPPPAFAASKITFPANGAELFYNGDSGSGSLHIAGIVGGQTPTAKGDLYCYSAGAMTATKVATAIDVSTGSFNDEVSLGPIAGQACQLALVPSGTAPLGAAALQQFMGPVISVSEQYTRAANGNPFSYYVLSGAVEWSFALQSLGDCPIIASYATVPATLASYSLFDGDGCLATASGIAPAFGSRSALQVDGLNAYPPAAISGLAGEGGFEPLSWSATYANSTHNGVTVQESELPVVCMPPGGYPPAFAVCPSLTNAGIKVRQTTTILPGGQVARVSQRFSSVSGKPHTIDLLLSQAIQAPGTGEFPGFEFPRQRQFAAHAAPDSFTVFPPGTGSILVIGDSVAAPSTTNPIGAITYSTPPKEADFVTPPSSTVATMLLHYAATVPARGSITYTFSYSQADTTAGLQPLEAAERDRYNVPKVRVTAPRSGLSTTHRFVVVSGRVSDGVGIRSVTVNGARSLRGATNTFRHRVVLKPGVNAIKVVATNFGGKVAVARLRVRRVRAGRHGR
jgi:hypothetical protein